MSDSIRYEVNGRWARIVLNRPEKRNALSRALLDELAAALWEADEDRRVHAILLSAEGPSFCAGYDLTPAQPNPEATDRRGVRSVDDDIWRLERNQRAMMTLFDIHKPVVAQVQGNCLAGGLDLVLLCDLVIAAENATFGFPPARGMGTLPVNMWLWHVPVQWAKRLLLTGDLLSGIDAAKIGLILDAVPPDQLAEECERLVERIATIDSDVLAVNKRSLNLAMELMGARTMQRLAIELDARGHQATQARETFATIASQGVREAVRQRDEPFGDSMIRLRNR